MNEHINEVAKHRVTFESEGETLAGDLYLPASPSGAKLPGVVVTGSWTTVKEQMAGLYARELAARGLAALAFDFRYWGESGGQPRQYESPEAKIRDIHNAARFLGGRPEVDTGRVGGLSICASSGYMAHAIARGAPIKAFVTVAAWLHDPGTVAALYGGEAEVRRRIEAGEKARLGVERGEEAEQVAAYDPGNQQAAMAFELDYYADPKRGRVPAWINSFAVQSWPEWLRFDALAPAGGIGIPVLMVHSDQAALPDNARRFYQALAGPKDLLWTQGTQIDFYDQRPQVAKAVRAAVGHFADTLGAPAFGAAPGDPRQAIAETVTAMLWAIDTRDWEKVRASLADSVRTDYTSLFGGEVQDQSGDGLVDAWRGLLTGFDGTQHLTGPMLVTIEEGRATVRCAVTAIHLLGDAYWTVGGQYIIDLRAGSGAWAIDGITLHKVFVQGDTALPERARERARTPAGA